jgi:hypothetical protein
MFEYGVWEDKPHEQLLWKQWQPCSNADSIPLPTWSWAATGGAKQCVALHWRDSTLVPLTSRLEISASQSLSSVGHLATWSLAMQTITRKDG